MFVFIYFHIYIYIIYIYDIYIYMIYIYMKIHKNKHTYIYISYPHITFQTFALEWRNKKSIKNLQINSPNSILPKNFLTNRWHWLL